jgi:hypothetical protein
MVTTKEPPIEERTERTRRGPKSQTRHVIRVRAPRAGSTQQKPLVALIVEAGIARSVDEARTMLIAGEICHDWKGHETHSKKDELEWQHGKPINLGNSTPSTVGNVLLDEDAKVMRRSKCPECSKTLVFTRRKPAISSTTDHCDCEHCDDDDSSRSADALFSLYSSDPRLIPGDLLEEWFRKRQEFTVVNEAIAVALARGAAVEQDSAHTAELLPVRNEDGSVHLKLVVR